MPRDALVLCGAGAPEPPTPPARVVRLDAGPGGNVRLAIEALARSLWTRLTPAMLDLLDVAAYAYAADQAVPRGRELAPSGEFGGQWRRRFELHVPVRLPDLWSGPAVRGALAAALDFPTDDAFDFRFRPAAAPPPAQAYLGGDGAAPDRGRHDGVLLFSGGLDSLGGAVEESLVRGRSVLLVHHRPTEKDRKRHDALFAEPRRRAGGPPPERVSVVVNKAKELGRETTQRTRSFLFAALAGVCARAQGLDRVRFYENGVVSLNLPPSAQVVGSRASRTTHPRTLEGYARLLGALFGCDFAVENPFALATKADVVRGLAAAGCADLIGLTTSCAHTWARTNAHTHCGSCSQCVDRRFAVLAAGLEAHDPAAAYRVDLWTGAREEGIDRAMPAAYWNLAETAAGLDRVGFLSRFGELTRAVRPGDAGAAAGVEAFADLYRRHARDVLRVCDEALARHAGELRRGALPATCLVRLLPDTRDPADDGPAGPAAGDAFVVAPDTFRPCGDGWWVRFGAGPPFVLLGSKGAGYLHRLLARPGEPVSACELALARPAAGDVPDTLSDGPALDQCRARAAELADEIPDGRAAGRDVEGLVAELGRIEAYVRAAYGPGGRLRGAADPRDKVRKAVGAALSRAVADVAPHAPAFAAHLEAALRKG